MRWVHLTGDEKLFGKLEKIGQDTLRLTTPWQDHLDVPLARVAGVHFGSSDRKESPESFAKRLKARGSEDLLLAQTKDGEVIAIAGIVEGPRATGCASVTRTAPGRFRSSRSRA